MPQPRFRPSRPSRYAQHLLVIAAVLGTAASSMGYQLNAGVGAAQANQATTPLPRPDPLLAAPTYSPEPRADRSSLSVRDRRVGETPLPTPVPIDPSATPLAAPPAVAAGPLITTLAFPVPGGSISQPFRYGHEGMDIAASPGIAVVAAESGTVVSAGWRNNGGGLVVEIEHPGGLNTVYNHLGSIGVVTGQSVARGTVIGGMGCSGVCYGPHIQFDVRVRGRLIDPAILL